MYLVDQQTAIVTWLENAKDTAEVRLSKVSSMGKIGQSISLVTTCAARSSGFPVLAKNKNKWLLSWTEVDGSSTAVRTGTIIFK